MVIKADKQRLRSVLLDAISLLCKSSLPVDSAFSIEATIGITLSENDIVLISFRELVEPDSRLAVAEVSHSASVQSSSSKSDEISERDCSKSDDEDENSALKETWNDSKNGALEAEDSAYKISQDTGASTVKPAVTKQVIEDNLEKNEKQWINSPPKDVWMQKNNASWHHKPAKEVTRRNGGQIDRSSSNTTSYTSEGFIVKEEQMEMELRDSQEEGRGVEEGGDEWLQVVNSGILGNMCEDGLLGPDGDGLGNGALAGHNTSGQSYRRSFVDGKPFFVDGKPFTSPSGYHKVKRRYRTSMPPLRARPGPVPSSPHPDLVANNSVTSSPSNTAGQSILNDCASTATAQYMESGAAICQICGARLSSASTLIKHIKGTHLEMSMCQCELCGEQFKWTMQLCRHRKRYHSDVLYPTTTGSGDMSHMINSQQYIEQSSLPLLQEQSFD